jgi:hypothetical protein
VKTLKEIRSLCEKTEARDSMDPPAVLMMKRKSVQ